MAKLLLFDVDKTLLQNSGHWISFHKAIRDVLGREPESRKGMYEGRTDSFIIKDALMREGLTEEEAENRLKEVMDLEIKYFYEDVNTLPASVSTGVEPFLKTVSEKGFIMGLVTGNLEPVARLKMDKFGLGHYFSIGGFGGDGFERKDLVKAAMKRAGAVDDVFLFGDTPLDVEAAKKSGVKSIGVATGNYSAEQLDEAGADMVVCDFTEVEKILRFVSE